MARKKYSSRNIDDISRREKGDIPRLSADIDLATIFGRNNREEGTDFQQAMNTPLSEETMRAVIREKRQRVRSRTSIGEHIKAAPPPQAEVDLHGHTVIEAERAAWSLLDRCRAHRLTTFRIITGKGLHSPDGPVLRDAVETLLLQWKTTGYILAFRWENGEKHKSGSVIVYR